MAEVPSTQEVQLAMLHGLRGEQDDIVMNEDGGAAGRRCDSVLASQCPQVKVTPRKKADMITLVALEVEPRLLSLFAGSEFGKTTHFVFTLMAYGRIPHLSKMNTYCVLVRM